MRDTETPTTNVYVIFIIFLVKLLTYACRFDSGNRLLMDPAKVVRGVVRGLAYQGADGASAEQFWEMARLESGIELDELLKEAVYTWVTAEECVSVVKNGETLNQPPRFSELDNLNMRFTVSEERQWLALTGRPKDSNVVGPLPFELLAAVARAGPAGVTAVDLHRRTGQDSRSIFGRIALLESLHLVQRTPVVTGGKHTHLIVFHRYKESTVTKDGPNAYLLEGLNGTNINKLELAKRVLALCKSAPSGLRLCSDLYKELNLNKVKHGGPLLRRLFTKLERLGVAKRVDVYSPDEPDVRYRCLQYVTDIDEHQKDDNDISDNEGSGVDDDDDDEQTEYAGEGVRIETMVRSQVDSGQSDAAKPLVNLFYPLVHQLEDLVASTKLQGLSAMDLHARLTGPYYLKPLGRLLDLFVTKAGQASTQPLHLGHLGLLREVDGAARVTFYRYFTPLHHCLLRNEELEPVWGSFHPLAESQAASLIGLNAKYGSPLPGAASIVELSDGQVVPLFHSDKVGQTYRVLESASTGGKKRGRPAKTRRTEPAEPMETQPTYPEEENAIKDRKWHGGVHAAASSEPTLWLRDVNSASTANPGGRPAENPNANSEHDALPEIKLAVKEEFSRHGEKRPASLAMRRRFDYVLQIVKEQGGAVEGGTTLAKLLNDRYFGEEGFNIDRKTLKRVISSLVAVGKLKQLFVGIPGSSDSTNMSRYIICDPTISANDPLIAKVKRQIVDTARERTTTITQRPALAADLQSLEIATSHPRRYIIGNSSLTGLKLKTKKLRKFGPNANEVLAVASPEVNEAKRVVTEPAFKKRRKVDSLPSQSNSKTSMQKCAIEDSTAAHVTISPVEADMLYRSVVISRSLYGKGTAIDWDMVAEVVPGITPGIARRRWPSIRDSRGGTKTFQFETERWEQLFLRAYSAGKLQYQPQGTPDFSLRTYVEFWQLEDQTTASTTDDPKKTPVLSRNDYESKHGPLRPWLPEDSLHGVFNAPTAIRVDELMVSAFFGIARYPKSSKPLTATFSNTEKVVRKIVAADDDVYTPEKGQSWLKLNDEGDVAAAIDALVNRKYLHYAPRDATKTLPGRNYELSERCMAAIVSKIEEPMFQTALKFQETLKSKKTMELPTAVEDGAMIPLLYLTAHGHAELSRKNTSSIRMHGDYRSRMKSKEDLECDIVVHLAADAESKLETQPLILESNRPLGTTEAPFIWDAAPKFWKKLLQVLVVFVTYKPHVRRESLCLRMGALLSQEEVDAAVDYLIHHHVLKEIDGLIADTQWYVKTA